MRKIQLKKLQVYQCRDNRRAGEFLNHNPEIIVNMYFRRRLYGELLGAYQKATGLKGLTVLEAHARTMNRKWTIFDGDRRHPVQEWIEKKDGNSLAILLFCCNPSDSKVYSESSIIMHPRDKVSIFDLVRGCPIRIYVPGEGYVDDDYYRLRKTIDGLNSMCNF